MIKSLLLTVFSLAIEGEMNKFSLNLFILKIQLKLHILLFSYVSCLNLMFHMLDKG